MNHHTLWLFLLAALLCMAPTCAEITPPVAGSAPVAGAQFQPNNTKVSQPETTDPKESKSTISPQVFDSYTAIMTTYNFIAIMCQGDWVCFKEKLPCIKGLDVSDKDVRVKLIECMQVEQ